MQVIQPILGPRGRPAYIHPGDGQDDTQMPHIPDPHLYTGLPLITVDRRL